MPSAPSSPPPPPAAPLRPILDSITIRGVLVAAAPILAAWLGLDPSQLVSGADAIITLAGLGIAVWGRLRLGDLHWPWSPAA